MELRSIVEEKYGHLEKCYGHCEQQATLKFLDKGGNLIIAGYSCPQAYLSRIIIYSDSLDLHQSHDTISRIIGKDRDVREEDVRIASRYPWDLGITTGDGRKLMTVAYWTQNYRRTKSEDTNREALFLCENCHVVFSQPLSDKQVLCSSCRGPNQPSVS